MTWGELNEIEKDFDSKRDEHECTVKKYAEEIQQCPYVHSLSFRVKETNHLIEKIIRKNEEYLEKGCSISINNYETRITDLMGIRVLLLFKEDWIYVHEYLLDRYAAMLMEEPFVHIRKGDDDALYKGRIKIKDTKPYRSAHYLLRTEKGLGIEIQVRTLYEEAWSEIDHKLRYPYNLSNNVLANYIGIMNRITGIGDEMGSFVNSYIRNAGLFIHNLAETFYDKNKLEGKVYFDDNIFENCLIDILVDIARLKYFHDISYVNYIKFVAYTASWCLKRKPFQLIEGCSEEYIYVNEKFALTILLQACGLYEKCTKIDEAEYNELLKDIRLMLYHLKYRNTNPQTLELLLVGLESGKRISVVE